MRGRLPFAIAALCSLPLLPALGVAPGCNPPAPAPVPHAGADPPPPNLVLVTVDTLRADRVGTYGRAEARTPAMDALARDGVRFERAFSTAPITLPAHASILTGRLPPRHGVRHNGLHRLGEAIPTLAEHLSLAEYDTAAFVGAFVLSAGTGIGRGFSHYDDEGRRKATGTGGFLERPASEVVDRALAWLARARTPFFLWVHLYDPHRDWRAPEPWASRLEDPYDAEIAYADAQIARLLDALDDRGLAGSTLVALTSDHGEGLGEHGEESHAYTLYDATLRVPLLLRGPGLPPGARVPEIVSLVDLAPTLLEALGAGPLPGADGRSRLEAITAGRASRGSEPSFAYSETLATELDHGWAPLFSLRTRNRRFVRAPRPELYAVDVDPDELHDLIAAGGVDPGAYRALDARLGERIATGIESSSRHLSRDERERLESLGYSVPDAEVPSSGLDPKDGLPLLARYREGIAALEAGDARRAIAILQPLLRSMPESAAVHDHLGRALAQAGRPAAAHRHAREAVRLLASAEHLAALAMIELQLGEAGAAARHFEAAMDRNPEHAGARAGAMWLAASRGDPEADRHEARALELGRGDWKVHQWLAALWTQLGRPDRALAVLYALPEPRRGNAAVQLEIGTLLLQLGHSEEAQRALVRAGSLAEAPPAANRLAIALAQSGRSDAAIAAFEDLLARHPDYEPARRNLDSLRRHLAGAASPAAPAPR